VVYTSVASVCWSIFNELLVNWFYSYKIYFELYSESEFEAFNYFSLKTLKKIPVWALFEILNTYGKVWLKNLLYKLNNIKNQLLFYYLFKYKFEINKILWKTEFVSNSWRMDFISSIRRGKKTHILFINASVLALTNLQ